MKKIFLSFLAVCAVGSMAFAQTYKGEQYLVNKFKDNWFVSVGAGVQTWNRIDKGDAKYNFKNKVNGEVEIGFGKYFTPVVGVRAMFQGGYYMKGYNTLTGANTIAETVYGDKGSDFAFKYGFVHVDGLVNLSNWIGGYKDRVYNATAAVGFGYARSQSRGNDNKDNAFAASLGLINSFRLCKGLDFNIELKSMIVSQKFAGDGGNGSYGAIPSVTAGFTYKFKERGWETNAAAIAAALAAVDYTPYTDRIADLEDELAASQARADKLAKELANAPKQQQVVTENIAGPVAVFFTIGKANISKKDKINLEYIAKAISQNPEKKYTVYGYADKETGNPRINMTLSEKRAKIVADALKAKGIAADRIVTDFKGDTVQPYRVPEENRVSICIAE